MKEKARIIVLIIVLGLLLIGLVVWLTRGGSPPVPAPESSQEIARAVSPGAPTPARNEASRVRVRESGRPEAGTPAPGKETAEALATGPGILTGSVVDEAGRPVSGAAVEVARHDWRDPKPDWETPALRATITDDAGLFNFRDLPLQNQRGYIVQAATADAFGQTAAYLRDNWHTAEVLVVLKPTWRLRGKVTDEAGRGVAGALMTVVEKEGQSRFGQFPVSLGARCGADGAFSLSHLPWGAWRFLVEAEGYPHLLSEFVAHDAGEVTFVLREGGALDGKAILVDTGEAAADLTIVAVATDTVADRPQATTDKDGAFVFPALRPAEYEMSIQHEYLVLARQNVKVRVQRGKKSPPVTLEVAEGGTVSGRVLDAESGGGVGGVAISAQLQRATGRGLPSQLRETESGADGAYHIGGLQVGQYTLSRGRAPGYRPMPWQECPRISVEAGRRFEGINFELHRGCRISGIVEDADGGPVAGAQVHVVRRQSGESAATQTGAAGRFEVAEFSSGANVVLSAKKGAMASLEEGPLVVPPEGLDDVVLTLSEALTASMEGVLVDHAERPLADHTILPFAPGGGSPFNRTSATTNGVGRFKVLGLAAGAYSVQVRPPGTYTSVNVSGGEAIEVKAGETRTGIRLVVDDRDEAAISGRVTNKQGQPVNEASVSAYGPMHAMAMTDNDGKYRVAGLKPGEYNMSVYHSDYSSANYDGQVSPGSRNVDFLLEGTGAIEGYVVDGATKEPVTHFEIAYFQGKRERLDGWMYQQLTQVHDPEGRFAFPNVSVGEATVVARAAGYAPGLHAVGEVSAGKTIAGIRIELEGGGALEGIVMDSAEVPLAGVKIFLGSMPREWARNTAAVATTDGDGTFHIDTLSPDDRMVSAYLPGYAPARANFRPRPGRTVQVEIRLNPGGEIRGTVKVAGEPAPRVPINARQVDIMDRGDSAEGRTDENGVYRLTGLADGEFTVTAYLENPSDPRRSRSMERPAVVEGDWVTEVNIEFLEADSAIEGLITVDGKPALDARVSARIQGPAGEESARAEVGSDGMYRLEPIPAGRVTLSITAAERERIVQLDLPAGAALRQDVAFGDTATISGVVAGLIAGANNGVALLSGEVPIPENPTPLDVMQLQRLMVENPSIDENGSYRGENIDPGVYTIVAYSIPDIMLGFRFQGFIMELKANEETVLDFDLNPQ